MNIAATSRPQPRASILINNYNYAHFLSEAIDSAIGQDYPSVEVIVVDDGSTDGSREIIASYGPRIIAVFQANSGQAAAFNAGFGVSTGDFVCFLDADDRFAPGKLRAIAELYRDNPGAAWCFHPLSYFGDAHPDSQPDLDGQVVAIDSRESMRRGRLTAPSTATSGLTFRRELLARVLPMPTEIAITSDNFLKFAAFALAPGLFIRSPLAEQRIHGSNAYTGRPRASALRGRIALQTARHLADRFPHIRRFASGHLAHGVGQLITAASFDADARTVMREYAARLPLDERLSLVARLGWSVARGMVRRLTR